MKLKALLKLLNEMPEAAQDCCIAIKAPDDSEEFNLENVVFQRSFNLSSVDKPTYKIILEGSYGDE